MSSRTLRTKHSCKEVLIVTQVNLLSVRSSERLVVSRALCYVIKHSNLLHNPLDRFNRDLEQTYLRRHFIRSIIEVCHPFTNIVLFSLQTMNTDESFNNRKRKLSNIIKKITESQLLKTQGDPNARSLRQDCSFGMTTKVRDSGEYQNTISN